MPSWMPQCTIPGRRAGLTALILAASLAAVTTTTPALADPPPTTQVPSRAAAGWLARQLVDGQRFEATFGGTTFPDQGLTADAVLAFDAAKVSQDNAAKATAWLAEPDVLTGYVGDGAGESYAGPHAKIALVAEAQGDDPTAFGGVDVIAALQALQAPSGRFSDRSAFGEFSNGISQALAVIALQRHGGAPQAAVDYLAGTQCPDGGFPLTLEQATCSSDVDTTGFAVQALLATHRDGPASTALDWLVQEQQADGGFDSSGPTPAENANSTGLAAEALRAGHRSAPADRAVAFLVARQVGCSGTSANQGAVAFDASGFDSATATRATTQAVPGMVGVSLAEVSADGAQGAAPVLDCHTATTPPTSTPPTSTPPTTATHTAGTGDTIQADRLSTPATLTMLASTGVDVTPLVGIGVLALLVGTALLLLARPRRVVGEDPR